MAPTMRYQDYTGRVEYDEDAGLFHGEVANLRDVITVARISRDIHASAR